MDSSTLQHYLLCSLALFAAGARAHDDSWMHPRTAAIVRRTRAIQQTPYRQQSLEEEAGYWTSRAQQRLQQTLSRREVLGRARNVIMFLGDGMSIPTLAAARTLLGQRQGKTGEESQLSFEKFPNTGLSKTYCVDSQVADSACTSTAYLCGVKANIGTMGVTAAVRRGDCQAQNDTRHHVSSILHWAQVAGKSTGVVTTSRVTHASPGGGYAHVADRDWESDADVVKDRGDPAQCADIATQLVTREPGRNIKVILGGGRREMRSRNKKDEEGSRGDRLDGRDLVAEWKMDKDLRGASSKYVWNRKQLLEQDTMSKEFLLGLFEDSHMHYDMDANPETEPKLSEMTAVAIKSLQKDPNGFFLFVEGARIDMAHHETKAVKALDETLEFSEAVRVAAELTDEQDTLIVVTSDHAHTMSVSGYPQRGNDILGVAGNDEDKLPYATLSYANGPGYRKHRRNITSDDMHDKNYKYPAMQPLSSETHGGDDVGVFSRGPWSHLLTGVFEQNYIPHVMAFASCVGDGLTTCHGDHTIETMRIVPAAKVPVADRVKVYNEEYPYFSWRRR